MANKNNTMEVQSLQRALNILEIIGNSPIHLGLKQIADLASLPKPTAYRLLRNLEDRNYISCDSGNKYRLGMQLLMMSNLAEKDFEIKQLAKPHLESLSELSKETVHFAILDHHRVVYIDTIESKYALRMVATRGSTNPVHCTALGKVLLSKHNDQDILHILAEQGMEQRTKYTITTPSDFLHEMQQVRSQGYALDDGENQIEVRCVGAPIYDHTNNIVAALSVSGLTTRFSIVHIEKVIIPQLLEKTLSLSRILGYVGC